MAIVGIHVCLFVVCCWEWMGGYVSPKCRIAESASPKRPVVETSCRRNVLSPKRRIAESASPKRPVAETSVAESSYQTIILSPNRRSPNRPIAESSSPKRPSPNRRRRNVLDRVDIRTVIVWNGIEFPFESFSLTFLDELSIEMLRTNTTIVCDMKTFLVAKPHPLPT